MVLDQRYTVGPQEHAYIEPEGVLAVPTREGGVIVYAPNQSPFVNHGNLAMVLDLPHNLVRVIQPPVGGSFGGKDDIIYESSAQVAKLALKAGRPVRMTFSREESMIASYKRDAMRMRIRLGADRDGTLRACKFEGVLDSGAYASEATFTAWRASIHAMGAYKYRCVRCRRRLRLHQQRLFRRVPWLRQHRGVCRHRAGDRRGGRCGGHGSDRFSPAELPAHRR